MTRRALKIGIAGAHSTGKSTLLNALQVQLEAQDLRVAIVKDLARSAQSAGFPILTEQTEDTALWIMAEGIQREAVAALTHDIVLVDRAIFDAFGYLEAALDVTGRPRSQMRHTILKDIARSYSLDYDLLVVTKLDQSLPLGSGRDENAKFRNVAGQRILDFAEELGCDFITMTSANSDLVEKQILAFVCNCLSNAVAI